MKVDIHTHILPDVIPDWNRQFGSGGFVRYGSQNPNQRQMVRDGDVFRVVQSNCWNPESRLLDMDRHSIDIQVLSTVPVMFSYWAEPSHALEVARYLNDDIARSVATNPNRFIGLGTLPMQSPENAVAELQRCMGDLGMAGVEIGSHVNAWNLSDEALFPVFQAAADLGAAVFVHPWDMMGFDRMPDYWLPWLVGMPAETSLAICSMIFGGVFERLPDLRVAFAHGGGSFPGTVGRIEHGFQVRPDLVAVDNSVNPRNYLGRFWVDSLLHDADTLDAVSTLFGYERVCLGSDYPFPLGEAKPGYLVERSGLSLEAKNAIMGTNAVDWLGVEIG